MQRAEELAHEVDHHPTVDQVYQLANLVTLDLLCLSDPVIKRQDEVFDEVFNRDLALVDIWVDFWSQFYQESYEAWEVKFIQVRVGFGARRRDRTTSFGGP